MIQEIIKIKYSYYYIEDDNGNFEDVLYAHKNLFIIMNQLKL